MAKRAKSKASRARKASASKSSASAAIPEASTATVPAPDLHSETDTGSELSTIPQEIRYFVYESVVDGSLDVRVGSNAKRKAAANTFNGGREVLASHSPDDYSKASLKGATSLLRTNRQINAEFSPLFYGRVSIFMSFNAAPGAYAALDRFVTISNESFLSQLKSLTFQFRIMEGYGPKADKESLAKALARVPNLEVLKLSVSDPCRDPSIDFADLDPSKTRVRWMPSTLLRLKVAQDVLPQLTKAFFENCEEHSEMGWYRHTIRLTTDAGTAGELGDDIEVDAEHKRYLATRKDYSLAPFPGLRTQESPRDG